MPAEFDQIRGAVAHAVENVHSLHAPPRAFGFGAAVGDENDGSVVKLDKARGGYAQHAVVPIGVVKHDDSLFEHVAALKLFHASLGEVAGELLSAFVAVVDVPHQRFEQEGVFFVKERHGVARGLHSARGVDARSELEGDVARGDLPSHAAVHEHVQAPAAALVELRQPQRDDRPVVARERHHVRYCGDRGDVEKVLRRLFVQGAHEREGDSRPAEVAVGGRRAELGIEDGTVGKLGGRLVMVGYYHVYAQNFLRKAHLFARGYAAVHADDEVGKFAFGDVGERVEIYAVTLRMPIGNIVAAVGAERGEIFV